MLANGGWDLTLILLMWTIWRAPTNASKWRMGFNSAFKGLITTHNGGNVSDFSPYEDTSCDRVPLLNVLQIYYVDDTQLETILINNNYTQERVLCIPLYFFTKQTHTTRHLPFYHHHNIRQIEHLLLQLNICDLFQFKLKDTSHRLLVLRCKVKVLPITGHEGPQVEYRYSPTLS